MYRIVNSPFKLCVMLSQTKYKKTFHKINVAAAVRSPRRRFERRRPAENRLDRRFYERKKRKMRTNRGTPNPSRESLHVFLRSVRCWRYLGRCAVFLMKNKIKENCVQRRCRINLIKAMPQAVFGIRNVGRRFPFSLRPAEHREQSTNLMRRICIRMPKWATERSRNFPQQ